MRAVSEILETNDQRWLDFLSQVDHDFYQLPDYVALEAQHANGHAIGVLVTSKRGSMLVPLILRKTVVGDMVSHDATSPYGYGSPLMWSKTSRTALPELLDEFEAVCRHWGLTTVFVKLHPFLDSSPKTEDILDRSLDLGSSVYVDLQETQDEIWAQMRRNHRQDIRQLIDQNYAVSFEDQSSIAVFADLYSQTMERLNCTCLYRFGASYLRRLAQLLGDHGHIVTVTAPDGQPACALVTTEYAQTCNVHLSATANGYTRVAPSKLGIYRTIEKAKRRDDRILHLGGGLGGSNDSLLHFKKGFSKRVIANSAFAVVLDQKKYDAMAVTWRNLCPNSSTSVEYFPQYHICFRCDQYETCSVAATTGSESCSTQPLVHSRYHPESGSAVASSEV